jgi:hypothetical protein
MSRHRIPKHGGKFEEIVRAMAGNWAVWNNRPNAKDGIGSRTRDSAELDADVLCRLDASASLRHPGSPRPRAIYMLDSY